MDRIRLVLVEVFRKPAYAAIAALSSLALLILVAVASNISLLRQTPGILDKTSLVFLLITGLPSSTSKVFLASLPFMIVLFGISMAMLAYSLKNVDALRGGATFGSLGAGIFGVGCPACGSAILSALGLSGALAVLPFEGQFIAPLSIALMVFSLHLSAKSIAKCDACFVKPVNGAIRNRQTFK